MSFKDECFSYHAGSRKGKIEVLPSKPLATQKHLSMAYTPGVAEICHAITENPEAVYDYTARGNLVAVVSNGTAVLGLGNIGPLGAKPVMEGKGVLFKLFADVDTFDICLDASDPQLVIDCVKALAPTFGGINLEDIKAPDCFKIEQELMESMDIPVLHDDQHGTAVVLGAALINAMHLAGKKAADLKVVVNGAGAAGIAGARFLTSLGIPVSQIHMFDSRGLIHRGRGDLTPAKLQFAQEKDASLTEALAGADCFIGCSVRDVITPEMIRNMAPSPIIFACANPDPEIPYPQAKAARPDAIVATGRSDYPNQVNNVLGFPFLFRAALDCRAEKFTEGMKIAAANALARLARAEQDPEVLSAYGLKEREFGVESLLPLPFDPRLAECVPPAVAKAAMDEGVARRQIDLDTYPLELRKRMDSLKERIARVL
ncbi:MAG: malate dehydrogenase [Desulfovibrionaceae bacterium]|nr:malate dehydrogenase [Desulfovibrionaceae bacterium]